jgi:dolichol-phosphate mannosyltransferase
MKNVRITILIPLYNEEGNLKKLLDELYTTIHDIAEFEFEILFVDDGSSDNTWQQVKKETFERKNIMALRLSRNFGKEAALAAGLEKIKSDAVIIMDSDLQHPPKKVQDLVNKWSQTGADIVEAVKVSRGEESLFNKLSAKLFYMILNKLSGFDLKGASDFKLLSRNAIEAWKQLPERNLFFRGMSTWLGFQKEKVFFEVPERRSGSSKWSTFKLLRLALTAITSFSSLPLHVVTLAGLIFNLFSIGLGLQTIMNWYLGIAVSGFTTVIGLQLFIGSLLMISLGIIGEYIARIYSEVKRRPRYIVSEIVDITK